jgi:cycloeucalenol cycloisomerase
MAYTLGSAFYGIYFIVSFPMFLMVDEDVTTAKGKKNAYSMWRVVWESLGSCMLVTLLLDFVRIGLTDVSFTMK